MASGEGPPSATPPTEITRARQLLSQAVQVLGGTDERPSGSQSTPSSVTPTISVTGSPASSAVPSSSRAFFSSALSERNLLFNFECKRSNRGGNKGGKSKKCRVSFWSHDFICLAHNDQVKTPTGYERSQLLAAGLGIKRLTLSLTDDYDDVHYYILEAFPKLKGAGGYELLRSSNGRVLEVIPAPPEGYSAAYLKDVMQQAKIFIRPIQRSLSIDVNASVTSSPKEKCLNCGKEISFADLRSHMESCKSESDNRVWDSDLEDFDVPVKKSDVEDSEETMISHAVTISTSEGSTSSLPLLPSTLPEVISHLQSKLKPDVYEFQIYRDDLLNDLIKATKRPSFDPEKRVTTWFVGECGRDTGGVTRELWRLLGYSIVGLCDGQPNNLSFRHDSARVAIGDFHSIGMLVGMAITQGGSGYPFFAPPMYHYVCGRDVRSISPSLQEVPDHDLYAVLVKLLDAVDEQEARRVAMESCDILLECGFTKPLATLKKNDVNQLVKGASLHSTLLRVKSEIDQFISGLDAAHVLHAIREYPDLFAPLFVYQKKDLTADIILDLFKNKMFSNQGSSQLQREQTTYIFFRDLLYEVEGGEMDILLKDVLSFFTGAEMIPPLGFEEATLSFNEENPYPTAFTCGLALTLPSKHQKYDEFKEHFIFAMCNHGGFGLY